MTEEELEQAMLEEAIRISLLEHQSRDPASNQRASSQYSPSGNRVPSDPFSAPASVVLGPTVSISDPFADVGNEVDDFALLEAMRLSRELSSQPTDLSASSSSDCEDEDVLVRKPRNSGQFSL
jgi:hypothetical protein